MQSLAEMTRPVPVQAGASNNVDGPKVNNEFSSTRALVKSGYMLEPLSIRRYDTAVSDQLSALA